MYDEEEQEETITVTVPKSDCVPDLGSIYDWLQLKNGDGAPVLVGDKQWEVTLTILKNKEKSRVGVIFDKTKWPNWYLIFQDGNR